MAKDQGSPIQPQEKTSDKPRLMGSLAGKPRALMPADDSEAAATNAAAQSNSGPPPLVLPAANEVSKSVGQARVPADLLAEPLRASHVALDGLLAKTHEIHEEIWRAVESLLADLHVKLRYECESRIAEFDKEIRERGQYQTATLLDQIDLEAESRLAARVDQALDKAQEAERRGSQMLNEKLEASRASFTEITAGATQELQRRKGAALEDLQTTAVKRLNDLKAEHESNFKALAEKNAEALNERLVRQADSKFQSFQERLKTLGDEATGQAQARLKSLTEAALAGAADDIRAMITRETSTSASISSPAR
jgi:hypothetical protein